MQAQRKGREDCIVLAHYYTDGAVQAMADYVGDSYYLAKVAAKADKGTIVFCGVRFMGESAKILNPGRRVLLPDDAADCPMAHMASAARIRALRAAVEDLAVVCYINSTAQLKAESDVCVTSSNAVKIVSALPNKNILFIPDENLGRFVHAQVPGKKFYYSGGYCPVHAQLLASDVESEKLARPNAPIIAYAEGSGASEFILCTEPGVLWELSRRCPGKRFVPVTPVCADMKRITPAKVEACFAGGGFEVQMDEELMRAARRPLERMLELAR